MNRDRTSRIRVFAMCMAIAVPTLVAADDADRLVAQLADPDFALRESAHRKLSALGAAARPALEKTAESKDVEQRLRGETLLRDIRREELWTPPRLSFDPGERDVKPAFVELAKLSGNPFNWTRSGNGFNGSVALTGKSTTYWEALEDLCRQSNTAVHFYDDPNGQGVTLVRGPAGLYPTTYAGPVRFRLQSLRRSLQREIHFGEAEPEIQDSCSIAIQMHWEQRAELCRYRGRPTILELRTDAGEDLKPLRPERSKDVMMAIKRREREINFSMTHQPPTRPSTKFAVMRFALDLTLAGEFENLEIPIDKPDRAVETDGYRLQIDQLKKNDAATTIFVRLVRAEALDVMNNTPELVDERMVLVSSGKPVPYEVKRTDGGRLRVQYMLVTTAPLAADAKLHFRAPRLRASKRVEIVFKDVPLP